MDQLAERVVGERDGGSMATAGVVKERLFVVARKSSQ